ncbi:MAG: lysoplasmalogenase [Roseovarius sp.]
MVAFLAVSCGVAVVYGLWLCHGPVSVWRSVVKTVPVALLAVWAAMAGGPVWLVAALGLSAVGDFALSREGERAFLVGLCAFALAHVAYIALLLGLVAGAPPVVPVVVLLALAVSTELWLAPFAGEMRWPVRGYVVLITVMAGCALALPGALWVAAVGAGAFVLSDTLLAVQMFRRDVAARFDRVLSVALWTLYFGAQVMMAVALAG